MSRIKRTPQIGTRGRYTLIAPWFADPSVVYTCIAVRSFEDLYKRSRDVYEEIYLPKGLTDQVPVNGDIFSFQEEVRLKPNLVTLKGSDGSLIYVPDTYIESYPDMGAVNYERIVLSADLGALPDYLDLADIIFDVSQLISARMGVECETTLHRVIARNNPTPDEHNTAEAARLGGITVNRNLETQLIQLQQQNAQLDDTVKALMKLAQDKGFLPTGG